MLGVNPGGAPENYATETVGSHTQRVLTELPDDWSAYRDENWEGAAPGTHGMAPRVLHLLRKVGLSPGTVPASNLIFVRSRREQDISKKMQSDLIDECWPFHALVIESLRPRVILCLGTTAGNVVCSQVGATRLVAQYVEENKRRWKSRTFAASTGLRVVVAAHPSIADWCAPASDPSALVQAALE